MEKERIKHMRKRILSMIICLVMCLSLLPDVAYAAGPTADVATWDAFAAAVSDPAVTTINVTAGIASPQLSGDDALVIGGGGRDLTITGSEITVNNAGIVLGGNVTFQNISLNFTNPVRNAIIANGYALTLENVTGSNPRNNISLFCGGITDYCGSNGAAIPTVGNAGRITLKGNNTLGNGNIYAGSLSDVTNAQPDTPNAYGGTAVITLEPGAGGMGDIYACGARENRQGGFGNEMIVDAAKYQVTGGVTVNLSNNRTNVYGATGGSSNAAVNFTDAGNGYTYSTKLKDIGSLTLNPGNSNASMQLNPGSSFSAGAAVSLPANTRLDFSQMADTTIAVGSLNGGGTLVLGDGQVLAVDGAVAGTTKVAVGGVSFDGNTSTGVVRDGQTYLQAPNAGEGSFALLPPAGNPDLVFEKQGDGSWIATEGGETVPVPDPKVKSFALGDRSVTSGAAEARLTVTATDDSGKDMALDIQTMDGITVSVNGVDAPYDQNANAYVSAVGLELYFTGNDAGDGTDLVVASSSAPPIKDGTYKIGVMIPGASTVSGQDLSVTATLTVGGGARTPISDDMVSLSETDFTYNGNPRQPEITVTKGSTILGKDTDYTVAYQRDGQATTDFTSAGTVTVVITGKGNYSGVVEKSYTIQKATPGMQLTATVAQEGQIALKVTLEKAGGGAFPGGTVQFVDITDAGNTQNIGSPVPVAADGTASYTWTTAGKKKYTLLARYSGDTNYTDNTAEQTIDTGKKAQAELTITSKTTVAYGQTLILTTRGGSSNGAVTYTVSPADGAKISGNILTPSRVGTVTVTAVMVGNDTYMDVASAPFMITITKGAGVGSVTMADWNYGEKASEPVPVSATNGTDRVTYLYKQKGAQDASYTADKPVNPGTYTVKAVFAATANYTEAVATADFTIHDDKNPGGGDPSKPGETTVEIPHIGGGALKIKAVIEGSGAILEELSREEAGSLVDGKADLVKIDLSGLSREIDRAGIPAATIRFLTEAMEKTDRKESLAVAFSTGTVTLDEKTMRTVVDQTTGSQVQLVLDNAGIKNLNDVQQAAIKDMKIYGGVEAYMICTQTGQRISDFRGGMVTLEIPFAIPQGLEASGFAVWYVDEKGAKTRFETDCRDGKIGWKTGHFSDFVIAYAKMDTQGGGDPQGQPQGSYNPPVESGLQSPKTGEDGRFVLWAVMGAGTAGLAVTAVYRKKYHK